MAKRKSGAGGMAKMALAWQTGSQLGTANSAENIKIWRKRCNGENMA